MVKKFSSLFLNLFFILLGSLSCIFNFYESIKSYPYSINKMMVLLTALLLIIWTTYVVRHYRVGNSWLNLRRSVSTAILALLCWLIVAIFVFFDVLGFLRNSQ